MLRERLSVRRFATRHQAAFKTALLAVTIVAIAFWIVGGGLKAVGLSTISDYVALAAYAATAATVVVGPLALLAPLPA